MANTKKNSAKRKLIPAIAMLTTSAIMLSTATYAWFTMNKTVSVTNMQVQAKADQGLLINEVATAGDSHWDELATTSQTGGIQLHATSTADTKTWYVAYSKKSNTAASATSGNASTDLTAEGYRTLGTAPFATAISTVAAAAGTNAQQDITYVDKDAGSDYDPGEGYYVKYTYYLKSSADAITTTLAAGTGNQSLQIKNVTVTNNNNVGVSGTVEDLDAALRVAIVIGGKAYIYAPVTGATGTYYVNASSTATTVLTGDQATAPITIPAVTADGTPFYVYLYFEGEDAKLKTDNVTSSLDNVTVAFDLSLVDNATTATDNGVTVPTT
jgi:hypothetical protein